MSLATVLPDQRQALPSPKHVDVDGIDTRYYEAGQGEPIVFIYGGNFGSADSASSAPVWSLNFLPLSERFKVIALDKLGQGHTGNPKRNEDYTMAGGHSARCRFHR